MDNVVMVFTSKSLETMKEEGGSGNWAASRFRIKHAKWIVATRNKKSGWTQGNEDHGNAFLIGRVTGIKEAPAPESNRFVVLFDRYADLDIPDAWTGNRNPVAYTDLEALRINPDELEWKEFQGAASEPQHPTRAGTAPSVVIDQARVMIAQALSISPEAVKITVSL